VLPIRELRLAHIERSARDLAELEPRIRQTINERISRGRMNVLVTLHESANGARKLALDTGLARSYHEAMLTLQKELNAPGEVTIGIILQAPGVMRSRRSCARNTSLFSACRSPETFSPFAALPVNVNTGIMPP